MKWARNVFKRKVAEGADPLAINRGVRIYNRQTKNKKTDPKFIKSPKNWLEEEKWKDQGLNVSVNERQDKLGFLCALVEGNTFKGERKLDQLSEPVQKYIRELMSSYNDAVFGVEKTYREREQIDKIVRMLHGKPLVSEPPFAIVQEEEDEAANLAAFEERLAATQLKMAEYQINQ